MQIDGNKLKQRRLALGLTQTDLAQRVGINQSHLAKLENGRTAGRTRDVQDRLAAALKTSPESICRGEAEPPQPPTAAGAPVAPIDPRAEASLLKAFDKKRHTFADVDAVRRALHAADMQTDITKALEFLLDASAAIRGRGLEPTPARLMVELAVRAAA